MLKKNCEDTRRCKEIINTINNILRKKDILTTSAYKMKTALNKSSKKRLLDVSLNEQEFINIINVKHAVDKQKEYALAIEQTDLELRFLDILYDQILTETLGKQ
jgi:hypothetical protein